MSKPIIVDELQEAFKCALVDAWKEIEGIKEKKRQDERLIAYERYLEEAKQRSKMTEAMSEIINYS